MIKNKKDAIKAVVAPFTDAMEKIGINESYLAKKLKEELEATEVKVFNGQEGVVYSKPLISWSVRQKGRMDANRVRGDYPAEELKHTGDLKINLVNYGSKPDNPS
ncbi:MAG: hypothetical protein ABIJ57_12090 [Pseudomonadota bacterium]